MNQQLAFRSESSEKENPHDSEDSLSAPGSMRGSRFYGWWMLVLAILIMVGTSPGQTFGITFFNAKFRDAFGLGYSQISVSYLVATLCAAVLLPFIGRLTDCWGLRRSVLVAVAAMATICICASLIQGWIALFFVYLALRTIGPGTMVLLANNTLAAWFDRRLGLAISLMQLSMAAAMAIVPSLLLLFIEQIGWRETYLLLGSILCCGLLPLLFFLYRSDPKQINQVPDGKVSENQSGEDVASIGVTVRQAARFASYWILLAAAAIWALIGTGLVFHLAPLVQESGLPASMARTAMVGMAIGMAVAQLLGGVLADRLSSRFLVTLAISLIAAGCGVLSLRTGDVFILGFSCFGLGQGLMTVVSGTVWPRYFGRAHLGQIRGVALGAAVAGSSLGPLLIGLSIDIYGSVVPALLLYTGGAASVAVSCLWAKSPALPGMSEDAGGAEDCPA